MLHADNKLAGGQKRWGLYFLSQSGRVKESETNGKLEGFLSG